MALKGIDIASYQQGINLAAVPADFVIVKATEGTGYTNPDWHRQAQQTLDTGKLLGLYHYSNGGDVVAEATYFLNTVKPFVGRAILFLDWEGQGNPSFGVNDYNWMNHWLTHVKEQTKTVPMVYFSESVQRHPRVGELKYDKWIAQYADMNNTSYQETPWNEGAYKCMIRQYSSCGRLPGWGASLDLNKFYGTRADWEAYYKGVKVSSGNSASKPAATLPTPSGSTLDLAVRTMRDEFGKGDVRKSRLGSRYNEVQNFINHVHSASVDTLVAEVKAGKYGNGDVRRIVLGARYDEVQGKIEAPQSSPIYYQIQSGDTLSAIAQKYGTSVNHLAQLNGIANPNYIMAGQKIRVR